MKTYNYYLIPLYILIAFVLIAVQIYCYFDNKTRLEAEIKMSENGYEQVVQMHDGWPKVLWKKATTPAEQKAAQ